MVMILSPPRNIFVRRTVQTLSGFLARLLNTNNQPRLSQKKILKKSRRLNICHRCNRNFLAFIKSSIIFHLQLCYGYQIPRNIFVRQTVQTLSGFLARFLNTNNHPRLSQKNILKKSRRPNICHRYSRSFCVFITSSTIFHLQLCYGYII